MITLLKFTSRGKVTLLSLFAYELTHDFGPRFRPHVLSNLFLIYAQHFVQDDHPYCAWYMDTAVSAHGAISFLRERSRNRDANVVRRIFQPEAVVQFDLHRRRFGRSTQ